ncbi:hypothetical protein GLAREA_04760 [Glarea lozoyensis ATCC 20868]|uniref:Uncharacterized protein n=1 Tax=Glarea lozoyensis (strain ATCC 20868 / MF5171) TaxID=1116229 RepID=S3CSC2_GLAL2|nr:uncharacterized protein GLAREA_04760 [Glarea lozoyensis ATCC 20868]EPE27969.1 hypothetical protein GLAREA_04760 [Glarea lozoyensis ATCC 20868]
MATTEFGPEDAEDLLEKILKLDEGLARNRWGSPQNMARSILMSNVTLQFLFHPNVFSNPETEAARIVQLLLSAATATDRKEAFKQTFPIYASENRNIGKVHPPLPEIPAILDQFWDGAMNEYDKIFKISHQAGRKTRDGKEPKRLKDMVQLVIADERRKKAEAIAKETQEAEISGTHSKKAEGKAKLPCMKTDDKKIITASTTKRSATWGAFVNRLQGKRPTKRSPPNVDGVESSDTTRVNSLASIENQSTDLGGFSNATTRVNSVVSDSSTTQPSKAIVVETYITDLDGACDDPDVFYEAEEGPKDPLDEQLEISRIPLRVSQQQSEDGGICEALRRMRFAKDGSLEAFISVDEPQEQN